MTAREHAQRAAELVSGVDTKGRLGALARGDRDRIALAHAHAHAARALAAVGENELERRVEDLELLEAGATSASLPGIDERAIGALERVTAHAIAVARRVR